jgi:hypothetical protein
MTTFDKLADSAFLPSVSSGLAMKLHVHGAVLRTSSFSQYGFRTTRMIPNVTGNIINHVIGNDPCRIRMIVSSYLTPSKAHFLGVFSCAETAVAAAAEWRTRCAWLDLVTTNVTRLNHQTNVVAEGASIARGLIAFVCEHYVICVDVTARIGCCFCQGK